MCVGLVGRSGVVGASDWGGAGSGLPMARQKIWPHPVGPIGSELFAFGREIWYYNKLARRCSWADSELGDSN